MRRILLGVAVLVPGLVLPATAVPARACGYGQPSEAVRFAQADCVVVGKVTVLEERTISALPTAGATGKVDYTVAVLEIREALKGAQGLTHLRIGLVAPQTLQPGFEACFFLREHFQESFLCQADRYDYPIPVADNPGFAAQMSRYRTWGRLLNDPIAGLKSKDAGERFLTAALLINKYTTYVRGFHSRDRRTQPIDTLESTLILQALATGDWSRQDEQYELMGSFLFAMLRLQPTDGWQPQQFKDAKEYETAAKQWLKDHAATHRINAFVAG